MPAADAVSLSLGNMVVHLRADATQMGTQLRAAEAFFNTKAAAMSRTAVRLSAKVTLPLAAMGATGVFAFSRFDDAMTKSLAIMGNVSDDMRKEMERTALTISKRSVTSAKDLADSYFFLASAGKTAEQSIKALSTVETFAVAGAFDMAKATDLLTDAQSALGLTAKDTAKDMLGLARVSDVLVKANTLANASVEQFATSLTVKSGAALRLLNKDVEEGVAVLAAFADQGLKGRRAGNSLNIVLRDLQRGAIDNAEAWDNAGLSVFDTSGKMKSLVNIIGQLEGKLLTASDKQKRMTLSLLGFNDESVSAIQSLLGMSGKIAEYERKLRLAGGTTQQVADKQLKSFSAQIKITRNQIAAMSREIGEVLAPGLLAINKVVRSAVKTWDDLSDRTKQFIVAAGVAAAALGPALLIFAKLLSVAGSVVGTFAGVASAVGGVVGKILTMGGVVISVVSSVAGAVTAAGGSIVAAVTAAGGLAGLGALLTPLIIPALKIAAVVAAITTGLVVMGVAGAAAVAFLVFHFEAVRKAIVAAKDMAMDMAKAGIEHTINFAKAVLGFMVNFRENMSTLSNWFGKNWRGLFVAAGKVVIKLGKDMLHNLRIVLQTVDELVAAAIGFLLRKWRQFSLKDSVNALALGTIKWTKKLVGWATKAKEIVKSIWNKEDAAELGRDYILAVGKAFAKGSLSDDFTKTALDIIKKNVKQLRFDPLDIETQLKAPELNLTINKDTAKAQQEATQANTAELAKQQQATNALTSALKTTPGLKAGSAEAAQAMAQAQAAARARLADKKDDKKPDKALPAQDDQQAVGIGSMVDLARAMVAGMSEGMLKDMATLALDPQASAQAALQASADIEAFDQRLADQAQQAVEAANGVVGRIKTNPQAAMSVEEFDQRLAEQTKRAMTTKIAPADDSVEAFDQRLADQAKRAHEVAEKGITEAMAKAQAAVKIIDQLPPPQPQPEPSAATQVLEAFKRAAVERVESGLIQDKPPEPEAGPARGFVVGGLAGSPLGPLFKDKDEKPKDEKVQQQQLNELSEQTSAMGVMVSTMRAMARTLQPRGL